MPYRDSGMYWEEEEELMEGSDHEGLLKDVARECYEFIEKWEKATDAYWGSNERKFEKRRLEAGKALASLVKQIEWRWRQTSEDLKTKIGYYEEE